MWDRCRELRVLTDVVLLLHFTTKFSFVCPGLVVSCVFHTCESFLRGLRRLRKLGGLDASRSLTLSKTSLNLVVHCTATPWHLKWLLPGHSGTRKHRHVRYGSHLLLQIAAAWPQWWAHNKQGCISWDRFHGAPHMIFSMTSRPSI